MVSRFQHVELPSDAYNVAILCALDKELLAVRALFDQTYEDIPTAQEDTNHYALGRIGPHNVVTTCLPAGEYGTSAASDVVQNMRRSFPQVEFCLLVGIGGGAPSADHDIRLGDVIVSHPNGPYPAVIQYDMGKFLENGEFYSTGVLQPPPRLLMKAIGKLKSNPNPEASPLRSFLAAIGDTRAAYRFPGHEKDTLFAADAWHMEGLECDNCTGHVLRHRRDSTQPQIHYGPIASGNQVIRSAKQRDFLAMKHKILCFEMEAAGVMGIMPCLVIRGICDYSDSHKNKIWQEYAAATAASYAKLLLSNLRRYIKFGQSIEPERASTFSPPSEDSTAEKVDAGNDLTMHDAPPSAPFDRFAALELFRPTQDPQSILQKQILFSRRRPSWNPWPSDVRSFSLRHSISTWISTPSCSLLTIHGTPACPLNSLPPPEDLACHIIQYLTVKTNFPVLWLFSPPPGSTSSPGIEAIKLLTFQALETLGEACIPGIVTERDATETQLLDSLRSYLSQLSQCFVIIEVKSPRLAEFLLTTIQHALDVSGLSFKAMIISYGMNQPQELPFMACATMPPLRLRGSLPGLDAIWNRVHPQFKGI